MGEILSFSVYVGQKTTKKGHSVPSFQRVPFSPLPTPSCFLLPPSPSSSSISESPSSLSRFGDYMFSQKMKQKMKKKPHGTRDGRKKQVQFADFPEDLFHLLFPSSIKVGKGWILTLTSEEAIEHHFTNVKKSWSDGNSARVTPPVSVFFSGTKRLRIQFYYTVEDLNGPLGRITAHAHNFDVQ
jgi:hypothetical protein